LNGLPALWLWGDDAYGQLGDSSIANKSSPVQTVAGGTNWKQVSVGSNHCFGVKTDGTLWGWGNDSYSKLGDAGSTKRSSPIQTVAGGTTWLQAACGDQHSAAVKTDGTLWTWGDNYYGTLGDNTRTTRNSPIQTISGGTNWKSVSGNYYTIGAIKTDGTLWLWGHNAYGQLGDNTIANKSSPVQTIAGGTTWSQVSCGSGHTVALKTDGTLWTWGQNTYGQLGDTTTANRSSPVQTIAGGTTWKQVVAGFSHTAAIKTDGTLWCWGHNAYGQLGDNTITYRSSPVQTIAGGTNWKVLSAGYATAAIKTDGSLWTWGNNTRGQLGDNTTTHKSSPIQTVAGGYSWKYVSCGCSYGSLAAISESTGLW
jgi:alpha-tubulin suppressor-like RCC1 family protein